MIDRMKPSPRSIRLTTTAQRKAAGSPLRIEILEALRRSPMTVARLARELGRAADSLYYHLRLLERTGFLTASGRGSEGTRYALRSERFEVAARKGHADADAERVLGALLRLAHREATSALRSRNVVGKGRERNFH